LLTTINSLPKLTHLRLNIRNQFPEHCAPIQFPILGQLHHFDLSTSNNSLFAESFAKFASRNADLWRIDLGNESVDSNSLVLALKHRPDILSKITWFETRPFQSVDTRLEHLCASLPNLTSLSIVLDNLYLVRLANSLSVLRQLSSLQLQ